MIELRFLGPIQFLAEGQTITLQSRKAVGLLAYLALTGRGATRPFLAELFWPGQTEQRGRANLSWLLSHLRKHLPGCLQADSQGAVYQPDATVTSDFSTVQRLSQSQDLKLLEQAAELLRGDLLAGFALDHCPEFELWLMAERERWRQMAADLTLRLVRGCRENGAYGAAISHARQLLALAPWRESGHRELIWLLALTGQRTAALRQYDRCRQVLSEELGISPSAETVQLAAQIEAGELAASSPAAQENRPFRPPVPTTPFFGRTAELTRCEKLLLNPACRLLTINGIGGIGKTRLAIEAAQRMAPHFKDGALLVSLAPLVEPGQIPAAIAKALLFSVRGADDQPLTSHLVQFLNGKELLLLLDNFEHLTGGVQFLLEILAQTRDIKFIVTSRVRLNIQAETILHLDGLARQTPAGDNQDMEDALALFLERAKRVQPTLSITTAETEAIQRLTALVGGHPLALELAAAQVNLSPIESVVADAARSIDALQVSYADLPQRHHSIEAIFELSWGALSAAARKALAQLALCQAGCTPQAAQHMTGASRAVLIELVNQAFINLENGRYQIHELLRRFALAQLQPEQLDAREAVHAHYYLPWLSAQSDGLRGPDQQRVLEMVGADFENIRRGWRWVFQHPTRIAGLPLEFDQLCWAIFGYWQRVGNSLAGAAVFAEAADLLAGWPASQQLAARLRAYEIILYPPDWLLNKVKRPLLIEAAAIQQSDAMSDAALLKFSQGYSRQNDPQRGLENDRCRQLLAESLALFEAAGAADRVAMVRFVLAGRLLKLGDGTTALTHLQASLVFYRQEQDGWAEARTLQRLGRTSYALGDFEGAADYFSRCRTLNEAAGFRPGLANSTRWLGNVAFARGQYDQAHARYLQALELEQEAGDPYQIGRLYNNLGAASKRMCEYEQAQHWYHQSLTIFEGVEETALAAMVYNNLGLLSEQQGHYEEALALVEKGLQMRLASGGRLAAASDYINLGSILSALGEDEKAAVQLLQALELALESGREAHIIEALTGLAQVHALQARPEQAAHLASLTLSHPAAEHQTIERAKSLLGSLPDINPVTFDPAGLIELAYSELKFWVEAS